MIFIEGHLTKFGPTKGHRRLKRLGIAGLGTLYNDPISKTILKYEFLILVYEQITCKSLKSNPIQPKYKLGLVKIQNKFFK